MSGLFPMVLGLLGVASRCEGQPSTRRDTSLFSYQANALLMKAHGDTIWMSSPESHTRVIDAGDRITLLRKPKGKVGEETVYVIRGDSGYPTDSTRKPVAVKWLRMYQFQIASARRVSALTKGVSP